MSGRLRRLCAWPDCVSRMVACKLKRTRSVLDVCFVGERKGELHTIFQSHPIDSAEALNQLLIGEVVFATLFGIALGSKFFLEPCTFSRNLIIF